MGPAIGVTDVRRLRERLAAVRAIGSAVASARDLDELFRRVHREIARVLDATGFILGLYDEASQTVEVVRQVDSGAELPGGSFPLGKGFTSDVIRTRKPRLIHHWSLEGPRVQIQYATDHRGLPESGITVPLLLEDRAIGFLSVQSYEPEAYDEDDLLLLEAVAGQVAVAVEHLRRSKRLDAQLQRRVSELEVVLAGMVDALLIVDPEGRVVRLNHAARELLSVSDASVILGQPLDHAQWDQWPLGARGIAEALHPMIEAIRRGEVLEDVEVELRGNGHRVLSVNGAPLHDAAGMVMGGVIVFRDVTGRREVERLKDEILAIASHDLKTPVAVIKAQAQLLLRQAAAGPVPGEVMTKRLGMIAGQAERIVELLGLLFDLSRIEAGRLELERRPTDVVELAKDAVENVQAMTDRHRIVLEAPPSVQGSWDPRWLEQVLQNLLTNAIKYSPDGGTIAVLIRSDERAVTVCVRDQGVGLAVEDLERIFDRFYRAEGIRRIEGAGLGLYICQAIVDAHRGRIWAESEGRERGSTFCFTLPKHSPAGSSGESASNRPASAQFATAISGDLS